MTSLTTFLEGKEPDAQVRTLNAILQFSDNQLEHDHRYIQWLFPLETMSENVWESPILSKEEKKEIKASPVIQENMRRALARMTAFYRETESWLSENDHNHLRISRILNATRSLVGQKEATTFYNALINRIGETHSHINPENMRCWKEAVGLLLKRGTKIYLDIDGTLIHEDLTENYGKPAKGIEEFFIALRPYDTFWLTTHCMDGDPVHAQKKLKAVLPEALYADIERIQPTAWTDLKTEGIDWRSDFIWFDDDIYAEEWKRFETAEPDQQVIQMNLRENQEQLIEITRDILSKS